MRKTTIALLIALIVTALISPVNAAEDKPEYSDNYVPQIKNLSLSYEQKKLNNQYIVETSFDLTVRVHRNPLSVFQIYFMGPRSSLTSPCQEWVGATTLSYGSSFYAKQGEFKVPTGLVSRIQVGDWYEEKHQFKISNITAWPPLNLNFKPCIGEVKPIYIEMKDLAGHGVGINAVYDSITKSRQSNFNDLPLDPEQQKCENLYTNIVSTPCTHNINWGNLNLVFTESQNKSLSQIQVIDYQSLNISLQNQINSLSGEKTELQNQITLLKSGTSDLQGQITSLTSDKLALQALITKNNLEKSSLEGKNSSLSVEKTALQGQISILIEEKRSLVDQVTALATTNNSLTVKNEETTKKLNAVNKKIATICKVKPRPKGC